MYAASPEPARLPAKPILLVIAEHDVDVSFPIADFLYERRAGPMAAVTLLGGVHTFTCGEGCPLEEEERGLASIRPEHDWAVSNSYAVAFLKYVGEGQLIYAPLLFGQPGLSSELSPRGVLVRSDRQADALRIDGFQDDDDRRNDLGLPNQVEGISRTDEVSWLDELPNQLSQRFDPGVASRYTNPALSALARARLLSAASPGALYRTELGGIDVSGREVFVLRLLAIEGPLTGADLVLRFEDSAGRGVALNGARHVGTRGLGVRFANVIVSLETLREAGLDLTRLARFELSLEAEGTLLLDDLRFE